PTCVLLKHVDRGLDARAPITVVLQMLDDTLDRPDGFPTHQCTGACTEIVTVAARRLSRTARHASRRACASLPVAVSITISTRTFSVHYTTLGGVIPRAPA